MPIWDKWFRRKDDLMQALDRLEAEFTALYERRRYSQARAVAKQALDLAREREDQQDARVAHWHHCLGMAYEAAGNFERLAEEEYRKAIAIYRESPESHAALATSLMGLGRVCHAAGKSAEGRSAFEEAFTLQ